MRPFTKLISFDEALAAVLAAAVPIDRTERARVEEADGRVAAEEVIAPIDVPPFERAAMDGYAVIAADTAGASPTSPRTLRAVGRLFTGETSDRRLESGGCVEIATGAPMPAGANAVVMDEQTERTGDSVAIQAPATAGQNIGRRGADITAGTRIVGIGDALSPGRVGAIAGAGLTSLRVFERPRVAILSTGNEIVAPGQRLHTGQLYDINRFTLSAVVQRHGGAPTPLPPARDTLEDLGRTLDAVSGHDIAVFSGGSSVGDRDLMVDAIRASGEVIFHGIAVKPGKPTLFGRVGAALVFGMPGYPTSCLSNAYMLLVPLLRRTARLPPWRPETRTLPLARRISSTPDRHQFYTVRIENGRAEPAFKASGDITSMAYADGYIEVPAGTDCVDAGTNVTVTLF